MSSVGYISKSPIKSSNYSHLVYFSVDLSGLTLTQLMCFLNQSKMSPFFIISRHALSQLANHYGKAGGVLIQDNNTPWAFGATVLLKAFQQHCTVLCKSNWVVEHGGKWEIEDYHT